MEAEDFWQSADPATVTVLVLYGCVTFVTVAMAVRTWLVGGSRAIVAAISICNQTLPASPTEKCFVSLFVLFFHMTLLGLILLAAYILQHHPPFPHADRDSFDADHLVFLVMLIMGYSMTTIRHNNNGPKTISSKQNHGTNPRQDVDSVSCNTTHTKFTPHGRPNIHNSIINGVSSSSTYQQEGEDDRHNIDEEGSRFVGSIGDPSFRTVSIGESRKSRRSQQQSIDPDHQALEEIKLEDKPIPISNGNAMKPFRTQSDGSGTSLLHAYQTLELKGALSTCFLVYKLTGADVGPDDESGLFYNAAQVGSSVFVFLSGFGHAIYFYRKNDYRFTRLLQVLFRINFVALWLCLTLQNRYIFYYVCPLHSMTFLMAYATMRISRGLNYTKYGLRIKLLGATAVIFALWDLNLGLFHVLFLTCFPRGPSVAGASNGPLYEWYRQSHLHHWASFVGMIFAINYPVTELVLSQTERTGFQHAFIAKGIVGLGLLIAMALWIFGLFTARKDTFESTHPYFVFLPILSYTYFRNVTKFLREHHVELLKEMGTYALEVYLLHHHFFLTNGGESMLVLLPGYPKCNVIVTGALLLFVAKLVHRLTRNILAMSLPVDDEASAFRSLVVTGTCTFCVYAFALLMRFMSLLSMEIVVAVIVIGGILLYQTVIEWTWSAYREFSLVRLSSQRTKSVADDEPVARVSPSIIGTMTIVLLGLGWRVMSVHGAIESPSFLPSVCDAVANVGTWVPVDECNEFNRGRLSRKLGVDLYSGDCGNTNSTMQWGWQRTELSPQCPFHYRSPELLQDRLANRLIVFIGDATVRNLFFALCRALGDASAGSYDTSQSQVADITRKFGTVRVDYKWAPLANDQVAKLKRQRSEGSSINWKPSLVVVGGGTLDLLHVWATDEDQESHRVAIQKLSSELQALRTLSIPSIWCTPPVVNTPALATNEKRNQINELAVAELRQLYAQLHVEESASFVLDGPSYSFARVDESYDGVMYPLSIYDAAAQIMANSFDWLLSDDDIGEEVMFDPPPTGSLSNPFLGIMMVCLGLVGLMTFDGYLGFSYLMSLVDPKRSTRNSRSRNNSVAPAAVPSDLCEEAFALYHRRFKLPHVKEPVSRACVKEEPQVGRMGNSEILSLLDDTSCGNSSSVTRRRTDGDQRSDAFSLFSDDLF